MRSINVFSGCSCVGKSTYRDKFGNLPELQGAVSVGLNEVGIRYFGKRIMTKTEKVYRNQLAREEIQRRIIVDGASQILLDMPMLTRENHQEPFVRMVEETNRYLEIIEPERAALENKTLDPSLCTVKLNVVLLYCSLNRVRDRIERRKRDANYADSILRMEGVLRMGSQFEMPEAYEPLLINTTDESEEAEKGRMSEILTFFLRGEKPSQEIVRGRMLEAQAFLDELKAEAARAGVSANTPFLASDYQR